MVSIPGSAYGFQVRSSQPLQFLRRGGGGETLDVHVNGESPALPNHPPLLEWDLRDDGRDVRAQLYRHALGFQFRIAGGAACLIDPRTRTIHLTKDPAASLWELGLWGLPALLCFTYQGDLALHAAAVEVNDGAVLFGAPGRHGKTTLALAFHRSGHRVLSEDLACCRLTPQPAILPGPALLRLRPDMYDGAAPTGTRLVSTRHDRIYLELDEERRGSGAPVPIRAIVLLQESIDGVRLQRVGGANALPDLWALSFRIPGERALHRNFTQLIQLLTKVPVWNLRRPLSRAGLDLTVARVLEAFGS